jgi:SPP1 gp7 family putative phage head morphogenesis protein
MSTSRAGGVRGGGNGVPNAQLDPQEVSKIQASAAGREQAPGTRTQASIFSNWREAANRLGSPFEVEKIPISKLRDMRRDPMLGFGLSFIKTPHVRAKWFIDAKSNDGPNAQIAAHLDHDLRKIYADFVLQFCNSLDFGFQAIAKRYELRTPAAFYIETDPETGEEQELPVWSEGAVQPIAWKPFVALQPEYVEPVWKGEEFNGVKFLAGTDSAGSGGREITIDVYHTLWVTNERAQNFNSIWGYPRLGYAYRYWWSYWFRWAIADRAFERKADPSVKVYHPEGEFVDDNTGERLDYGEYALLIGERMRSGGVISLPSEVYEDANGRGTMRMWDVDFTKDAVNFEPFDKSFDYLDVQKLRSLWIPEQAFLEGKGGTSSRNVAAELGESFIESQAVLSAQISEHINRWLIPQWLAVNYPEFLDAGGTASIVIQGFADQDVEFTKEIIQLIGQQEAGMLEILKLVDLKRVLEDAGTPIADFLTQQRRQEEITRIAAASAPPAVAPVPGQQVGVVPGPTGFNAYINPPDRLVLQLADSTRGFLRKLPDTPHYQDKSVRAFASQLWSIWHDVYQHEYEVAATAIENGGEIPEDATLEFALSDVVNRATEFISDWTKSEKWAEALKKTENLIRRMANRAGKVELRRIGINRDKALNEDQREAWIKEHLAEFAQRVADTTRSEIRDFIAKTMSEEGAISQAELAKRVREHFSAFPDWKADRLARTETAEVYRAATLLAARAADITRVQAVDAQFGGTDDDCEERDGEIFDIDDAWEVDEHPNGTLAWRMVPANLSITYDNIDGAEFDAQTMLVTLSEDIEPEAERVVLRQVLDHVLES